MGTPYSTHIYCRISTNIHILRYIYRVLLWVVVDCRRFSWCAMQRGRNRLRPVVRPQTIPGTAHITQAPCITYHALFVLYEYQVPAVFTAVYLRWGVIPVAGELYLLCVAKSLPRTPSYQPFHPSIYPSIHSSMLLLCPTLSCPALPFIPAGSSICLSAGALPCFLLPVCLSVTGTGPRAQPHH